jgi:hypothetical protein
MKKARDISEQPIQIMAGEFLVPQIRIYVNDQLDGFTYQLDPKSEALIQKQASPSRPAASVFVSFDSEIESPWTEEAHWQHIAGMLTGLPTKRLKELGKVVFVDPKTEAVLFEAVGANV